jgi:A/G-specific adenine glycosylase
LPGFGDYTAGAVAAIAFGEIVPAVDGNVKRVLARLFAIEVEISRGEAARRLREIAAALVAPDRPGDWTQALMELGATICLPKSPRCLLCPVCDVCEGRLRGIAEWLPIKPVKKALPHYDVAAAVICQDDKILIAQRPLEGMLGGLWEFPGGKQEPGETLAECLHREIQEELGLAIDVGAPVTMVKHSYTHFKITLHAFYCHVLGGSPQTLGVADWRWITLAEVDNFAFPRTDLKVIEALRRQTRQTK